MSATEDDVSTGVWPRLRDWWGDKPKPHQYLVIAGVVATVVFLGAGVLLETWLEPWAESIPSLAPFVWDVAKGLLIGTVVFSVIDVLRSGGRSWRVLKISEDALYQEVEAFLNAVNKYLGLNLMIGAVGPITTTSSVTGFEEALRAVSYGRSEINDYTLALVRDEKLPGAAPNLLTTWEDVNALLSGKAAARPDRGALAASAGSKPIRGAAKRLAAQLRILTGPETSIPVGSSAAVTIAYLATIDTELVPFRKWLSDLAVGEAEPAGANASPSPTVEELREAYTRIPDAPFLTFTHLRTLLILANRELVRGAP